MRANFYLISLQAFFNILWVEHGKFRMPWNCTFYFFFFFIKRGCYPGRFRKRLMSLH